MDVVQTSMLLLLLAALGATVEPSPENCHGLNATLRREHLHKIFGDWVMVFDMPDHDDQNSPYTMPNFTSSHMELRLLADNHTVTFNEWNSYSINKCRKVFVNMSMAAEDLTDLHHVGGKIEEDGVFTDYNISAKMHFFESCDDCLVMTYEHSEGRFLTTYRRKGHHQDVDKLKEHHDNNNKLAECLGFPPGKAFTYDGAAGQFESVPECPSRMDVVQTSMLLLLLAALGATVEPSPENCHGLNATLRREHLHKIFGDWVMVFDMPDHDDQNSPNLMPNFTSAYTELRLLADNHTVTSSEWNSYSINKCRNVFVNWSMAAEDSSDLHHVAGKIEEDGVLRDHNIWAQMHFFESCDDCLVLIYKNAEGRFLTTYRRKGHHQDVDKLKEHYDNNNKLAECLGFPPGKAFTYDGAAGPLGAPGSVIKLLLASCLQVPECPSRMDVVQTSMLLLLLAALGATVEPSPENCHGLNVTLQKEEMHKIFGDWVMVWVMPDHDDQRIEDIMPNFTSSHMELRLLTDNHTVTFNEWNSYSINKCRKYFINMSVAAEDSTDLHHVGGKIEDDGVFTEYNESGQMHFFETCDDCLVMVYKNAEGRFLLIYRRKGHHQDVDKLKEHYDNNNKLAECLGFPPGKTFTYDGAADLCPKKSAPEVAVDPVEPAAES
ncbi:saxitoxin and tetrodotoxin-binding protein 1-like [Centropristis striata]|uniref:saxitoxin and tetrodotoxin-binding protein 1-like n=1 Tax=Centropristis striata TaxID=184440 RepID=UPI0027E00425|nr:saxitoxin and tetrodotoxin-binding protein 1-like [Centropristis striata]